MRSATILMLLCGVCRHAPAQEQQCSVDDQVVTVEAKKDMFREWSGDEIEAHLKWQLDSFKLNNVPQWVKDKFQTSESVTATS